MDSIASLASRKEEKGARRGQEGQIPSMVVPGLRRNPAQLAQEAGVRESALSGCGWNNPKSEHYLRSGTPPCFRNSCQYIVASGLLEVVFHPKRRSAPCGR